MKALIGLIAAVAVVGGGYYLYTSSMSSSSDGARLMEGATATDPNSLEQADGHAAGETETGTWNDLMGMSGAHKCTVVTATNGVESTGTVYVSGGSMRADFTSMVAGANVDSHIIAKGDSVYTWSSAMASMGIKSPRDASSGQATGKAAPEGSFDPRVGVNYSCTPWTVDAGMFELPAGVEFMDVSAMMQGMMK